MQKSRKNAHLNFTIGTNEFCDYTSQWSDWEFGTFTPEKLNRICLELGYTYADFQNPQKITMVEQMVISRKFSEILNKAYYDKKPILENDGRLMWVSGCVYANGAYPETNE